jgi:hypothetical protein
MARPKKGYYNAEGKRVPGSTTITGARKDPGGLMYWAWDLGMQGINYREKRDEAAGSGTLAHGMIEQHIDKKPIITLDEAIAEGNTEEQYQAALVGFSAARKWLSQTKIEVVEQEVPFVSEDYQYGGTPDAIGRYPDAPSGEFILLDWKTGKLYPTDHIPQIASYRQGWQETNPGKVITEVHLCHFGKEFGEFGHHMFPPNIIDMGWESFLHMRALYDLDKKLKKVA